MLTDTPTIVENQHGKCVYGEAIYFDGGAFFDDCITVGYLRSQPRKKLQTAARVLGVSLTYKSAKSRQRHVKDISLLAADISSAYLQLGQS